MKSRLKVKMPTRQEFDYLVYAPDRAEAIPPSLDLRTINGLAARKLIVLENDGLTWRISDYGKLMIRHCIKEWKLQLELPL